jgi:1,4-alpha-glucan branching enzyme
MSELKANIALVLNAHLPFVRHPEYQSFLEENWLFEAINETYLPLLRVFRGLEADRVPFRLTMSFSPTLTAMLGDPILQDRYLSYLERQLELAEKEIERTKDEPEFHSLAKMYRDLFKSNYDDFVDLYQADILRGFSHFQKSGNLEIITSAATHAFLPLYQDYPVNVEAQLQVATDSHFRYFAELPRGIWLPECGYYPGLDKYLEKNRLEYFFVAAHGALFANEAPWKGVFAPLKTPAGRIAFPRDLNSTDNVWSHEQGYPGDPVYRDFYRDIGFDLDMEYIGPYIEDGHIRINTGFKYYAITGETDQKLPYNSSLASRKVKEHALNFLYNRVMEAKKIEAASPGTVPMIVTPYDAELFGHWWFEGPQWLDQFFRSMGDFPELNCITPGQYIDGGSIIQKNEIPFSSWGTKGFAEVWLDGKNDWIYRHTHKLIERMQELCERFPDESGRKLRALNQAAREVMLAQASDWPMIIRTGTTVQYAEKRLKQHISNFTKIYNALSSNKLETEWLTSLEKKNNIFPGLDYKVFKKVAS